MKLSPYDGIIRIRLKGSAFAISAIMGTPDFYAVFMVTLYTNKELLSILFEKLKSIVIIYSRSLYVYLFNKCPINDNLFLIR